MNKRGQFEVARKTIYWMMAGVVITIVVVSFAMIMASYKSKLNYVPEKVRAELLSLRFVSTPECFTYQDEITERIYPRIIDLNKFNKETLFRCYHTETEKGYKDYNFRLYLVGENKTLKTNNYFYKDDFTLFKKVIVKKGGELVKDELRIYVQTKI